MALKCLVPGCEDSEKEFQPEAALKSHICNAHLNMKEGGEKSPDYRGGLYHCRTGYGKRTDIMRKSRYGTCDKLASR